MDFHKISIKDKEWITKYLNESDFKGCCYSFGTMILWKDIYQTEVAEWEGTFCYRYYVKEKEMFYYAFPAGRGNIKGALEELRKNAGSCGQQFVLNGFENEQVDYLEEEFPGKFEITTSRDEWDYVYDREALATLSGSKYQSKRNHIARFKDCEEWHYEELSRANMAACGKMSEEWYQFQMQRGNVGVLQEIQVLKNAFEYFEDLELTGGVLYRKDRVVAFTIGEAFNDEMYHVHIEKAYADIQGAYPMINQQYVLHAMEGFRYVNREEDVGEPGLRKAKESYRPVLMIEKYRAVWREK